MPHSLRAYFNSSVAGLALSIAWLLPITGAFVTSVFAEDAVSGNIVAAIKPYVERKELAGAVMLAASKETVYTTEAVGWANIESQRPMQKDSMFWIASQSKPITAVAVMMLVDEGKIQLDDPIAKYLPEFGATQVMAYKSDDLRLLKRPASQITIRQTLAHTSGMPFRSGLETPTLDLFPLKARVLSYAMTPLDSEPGTKYQYSNAGINTAARIIEVVTKQSFEQFLDERLLRPLGMTDTTFWPTEEQVARIATAYKPRTNKQGLEATPIEQLYYPLTDRTQRAPMPAGGLFGTAHDLARFYRMLLNDGELDGKRYLSPAAVKELTTKQTPADVKENYGLGFSVGDNGHFNHGGAYSTLSSGERGRNLILVWLVQHAGYPGEGEKAHGQFRELATKAYSK